VSCSPLEFSNVISQAASGYLVIFSKELRVNDYVRFGEYEGTILSVGILSTKIRTARDEEINAPNAVIVSSMTKNYTRLNRDKGAPLATSLATAITRHGGRCTQCCTRRTAGARRAHLLFLE